MLADDEGKQRQLEGMAEALQDAETVLADVGVLRGVDDEALVGEGGSEVVIEVVVDFGIGDVGGAAFEPVLADDNRAALAGAQVFGDQKDSAGEDLRPDIEHYLVAREGRLIENEAGARVGRQRRRRHAADDFIPDVVAIKPGRIFPRGDGRGVGVFPESFSRVWRFSDEGLGEIDDLIELAMETGLRVVRTGRSGRAGDVGRDGSGRERAAQVALLERAGDGQRACRMVGQERKL